MARYDSPKWSYFSGCTVHKGRTAPCSKCIAEGHQDLIDLEAPTATAPAVAAGSFADWFFAHGKKYNWAACPARLIDTKGNVYNVAVSSYSLTDLGLKISLQHSSMGMTTFDEALLIPNGIERRVKFPPKLVYCGDTLHVNLDLVA